MPGRGDDVAQKFESELYLVLEEQHQRIDLFVKSKAREIQHRLGKENWLSHWPRKELTECAR